MKNVKKFVSVLSVVAMASCMTNVIAYADEESDMIAKDEIIEYVWNETWNGNGDDGTVFPEASYRHNQLENWIEGYYGKDENGETDYYEWSDLDRILDNYLDYSSEIWENWHCTDYDDGSWTIERVIDEETMEYELLYRFEFINGMWNQIDVNGNTVDTFPPFSTLEEDEEKSSSDVDTLDEDGNDGEGRVTGITGTYYPPETTTVTTTEGEVATGSYYTTEAIDTSSEVAESVIKESTSSNYTVLVIGGVTVLVLGAIAVVAYKKKK